ncbi:MAG: hypothetical protein CL784_08195 [Chloroflexi bacterium]|nr:hypothetical protein [Chloroflexota bacterium]|tara:strand:- start:529 stop:1254 length:726 start_codon:yes stop_codon:yes gene_type:complete
MAAEELGNLGKAAAGDIMTSRKVYFVTLVQPSPGAPDGFEERYNAYWEAVEQQVSQLEAKAGTVMRVFAEGVIGRGDDAMLMVQQTNPGAHRMVRQRVSAGAVFEEFEDTDIFGQVIDWGRCLQSGLINQTVANTIQGHYTEAADKRSTHLLKRLDEGILESEAALVLTGDQNLSLPDGVEKFVVSPPELDELERWVQQANEAIRQQMSEEQARATAGEPAAPPSDSDQGKTTDSGLWTPG